jgi:hypothetical protein
MSNGQMMAADISVNGSTIQAGTPHALFDSGYVNLFHINGNYHVFAVSRDGQRFLIPRPDALSDDPNARTLTLFDRQGKTVGTVGERGFYQNIALSPDQTRVALLKPNPAKGTTDVWVLDLPRAKARRSPRANAKKRHERRSGRRTESSWHTSCPGAERKQSTESRRLAKAPRNSSTSSTEQVLRFRSGHPMGGI